MESARLIKVIKTKSVRGNGSVDNPFRHVDQYWDLDGNLLWEKDPDLVRFENLSVAEQREIMTGAMG